MWLFFHFGVQRVPRTGWVYRKVKDPESVSDHMYRMAMMSLTITDPTVDRDRYFNLHEHWGLGTITVIHLIFLTLSLCRCIKLALVHDMAECIVGDIAPADNVSKEEKHRREAVSDSQLCMGFKNKVLPVNMFILQEAMRSLSDLLPNGLRQEIYALWEVQVLTRLVC